MLGRCITYSEQPTKVQRTASNREGNCSYTCLTYPLFFMVRSDSIGLFCCYMFCFKILGWLFLDLIGYGVLFWRKITFHNQSYPILTNVKSRNKQNNQIYHWTHNHETKKVNVSW